MDEERDKAWTALDNFDRNKKFAVQGLNSYNTKLSVQEESDYRKWLQVNQNHGPIKYTNPDDPYADYDMRGFFKDPERDKIMNNVSPSDGQVHFTDKYKTPYHESFSNESQYADPKTAPRWVQIKGGWQLQTPQGEAIKTEMDAN